MNKDQLKGQWPKLQDRIKREWVKLTDDDLDQINGNYDTFVGRLQQKYGHTKEEAQKSINNFMRR